MSSYPPPLGNYGENPLTRSPRSFRNQSQVPRQPSRQFDAYGPISSTGALYAGNDSMARYDTRRMDTRFGPPMQNSQMNGVPFPYDVNGGPSTWNAAAANAFAGAPHTVAAPSLGAMAPIGSQAGRLRSSRPRGGLPGPWLDQPSVPQQFPTMDQPRLGQQIRPDPYAEEDELIPTALVIKNIPFAVKKETLVDVMTDMSLPLPYAFNYHFDNGVFRGLAFANFTTPEETAAVINHLNHFELQGRKLRVEYKKMLPAAERERIEQDKRWRRGQLEEQHRSVQPNQLQNQPSVSSLASHHVPGTSPSPVSQHGSKPNVDLNDQQTLNFYTELVIFKNDPNRENLVMSPSLSPEHRRTIHALAHNLNLHHSSHGTGDQRQVHIMKYPTGAKVSPPRQPFSNHVIGSEAMRTRGLNRAATTDFGEARHHDSGAFNGLRGQSSVGLLGVLESTTGFGNSANLRPAKSVADLRSYTPSPAPSVASFTASLQTNGTRFSQKDGAVSSNNLTVTPTSAKLLEDNQLSSGLGSLSLGTGLGNPGSPRRVRNMFAWEGGQAYAATAPIGSNRTIGTGFDSSSQDRLPSRQPRGPSGERGPGFRRQNGHHGRGSDELRGNPEIIVE